MQRPDQSPTTLPIAQFGVGKRIKTTKSICPVCLDPVDADVLQRDNEVWMDKTCAEHGSFSALLSADARHYYVANPELESLGSCCAGSGCGAPSPGDPGDNHSCNLLIEITQRCNLECPVCYAGSSPRDGEFMPFEQYVATLDKQLANGKANADLIQLSGGEPTLHPDMFRMIEYALERGVARVYVNTNGIRLAKLEFVQRLAALGPRVSIYLQVDSFHPQTLRVIRGREDLGDTKLRALKNCEAVGLDTVPVMTVAPGVNDREIADVLKVALAHPRAVSRMMIQPAMYSGRYDPPRRVSRITVADVAQRVAACSGVFTDDDFSPIPCSDPNCFSMALALRTDEGLVPVSRYFPRYAEWGNDDAKPVVAAVSDHFDSAEDLGDVLKWAADSGALASLDEATLDTLLQAVVRSKSDSTGWGSMFAIGIKPFMDAHTYDQDRIDKCCVHIVASDGTPVSFCEYNAIRRPRGLG